MSGAIVGALRVVLGADTAALDKGLKDSQTGLASFGNAVQIGMAAVAASVVAAAAAITIGIKSAIDNADKLNKMSQSTGQTVEDLSKLKYAAELSDISTESLGKSLGKLSKAMVAVATEGASPAAQAFAAMGITVKNQDGTLRSSSDVLKDIAEKFAGYKDGAEKTSLAIALFGKAGASMIPLLNQGKDGLNEAGAEAEKFGLVLDKKTTLAAEAFNDNLKRMDAIKQGLYTTITAKMLPAFELFSEQLLQAKANSDFTSMAADGITTAIKFVVQEVMVATVSFRGLANELVSLWDVLKAPDWASLKAAWGNYIAVSDETRKSIDGVKASLSNLWTNNPQPDWGNELLGIRSMQKEVSLLGGEWAKTAAPIISAADAQKNAVQMFLDSQAKRIAGNTAEAATIGKSVAEQARLRIELEAQAIATAKGIALTPALIAQITATGDAAAAAALKLQGANLTQEMLAPWDLRNQKMTEYNTLLQVGAISSDTFNAASQRIQFPAFASAAQSATDFGQRVGELATNAIGSLSSALASVIMGTKSAAEAFKAFALQIITDLIAMIAKALIFKAIMTAIGFSGGGAVMGGTGFSLTGTGGLFADGGAVMGPGTGTSDSIPAMLSNGEFVVNAQATKQFAPLLNAINSGGLPSFKDGGDVGQSSSGMAAAGGVAKTVVLQGFMWGRDQMRDLFDALNEGMRDGHKLDVQFA